MNKIKLLEAFINALELTQDELKEWCSSHIELPQKQAPSHNSSPRRAKSQKRPQKSPQRPAPSQENGLVKTPLKIVYSVQSKYILDIADGFDPNRKKDFMGVQLSSGVILCLKHGIFDTWSAPKQASLFTYKGKKGRLPKLSLFDEEAINKQDARDFYDTIHLLAQYGVYDVYRELSEDDVFDNNNYTDHFWIATQIGKDPEWDSRTFKIKQNNLSFDEYRGLSKCKIALVF